jgi:uncharacterized protein YukE
MVDVTGSKIAVPTDVGETGTQLLSLSTTIAGEITTLQGQLAPLAEYWIGNASSSYQGVQQIWNKASTALLTDSGTLGDLARAIITNSGNYDDCESTNTKSWQTQ